MSAPDPTGGGSVFDRAWDDNEITDEELDRMRAENAELQRAIDAVNAERLRREAQRSNMLTAERLTADNRRLKALLEQARGVQPVTSVGGEAPTPPPQPTPEPPRAAPDVTVPAPAVVEDPTSPPPTNEADTGLTGDTTAPAEGAAPEPAPAEGAVTEPTAPAVAEPPVPAEPSAPSETTVAGVDTSIVSPELSETPPAPADTAPTAGEDSGAGTGTTGDAAAPTENPTAPGGTSTATE